VVFLPEAVAAVASLVDSESAMDMASSLPSLSPASEATSEVVSDSKTAPAPAGVDGTGVDVLLWSAAAAAAVELSPSLASSLTALAGAAAAGLTTAASRCLLT